MTIAGPLNTLPPQVLAHYIRIASTTIVDSAARVKIFNPPNPPRVCIDVDEDSHLFCSFNILRDSATIRVGKRCQLGNVNIVCAQDISIGDDVIMAWGINIMDSDNHSTDWQHRQYDVMRCRLDYVKTGGANLIKTYDWTHVPIAPVRIGSKVWVGMNSIILKGVTIGEGAVIGAGSVVTSDIPAWHIAAGNPCRPIKPIPAPENDTASS